MSYGDYPSLDSVKKILVIKLRHLGDVLLTTPVFTALKKKLPHAHIDAYIYKEAAPILQENPDVNGMILYDRSWKKDSFIKKNIREMGILRNIRKEKYDLVINLTEGDRGALATKASKASIRLGYDHGSKRKKAVYTHLIKVCGSLRHTVERGLDSVRRIGIFPEEDQRKITFSIPKKDRDTVDFLLRKSSIGPYLLVHPTSRWRFKCWPMDRVRRVIQKVADRKISVVVVSGKDPIEKAMIESLFLGMNRDNVYDFSGRVTLQELGAFIENSLAVLCVDSVCFHMANAIQANVIALFGPTSDVTWGPWMNPNAKVVAKKLSCRPCYMDGCGGSKVSDCLHTLEVERVFSAIDESLHQSKNVLPLHHSKASQLCPKA